MTSTADFEVDVCFCCAAQLCAVLGLPAEDDATLERCREALRAAGGDMNAAAMALMQ